MEIRTMLLLITVLLLSACNNDGLSDAYGQFETDRVTISSQAAGELLSFTIQEGMSLEAGQEVALIDTTQIHLMKEELFSTMSSTRTRLDQLDAQAAVYQAQLSTAQKELERLQALKATQAATQQQIDQAEGQVNTLQKQINATRVQKQTVNAEIATIRTRLAQVEDQLSRSHVKNPVRGTVLRTFVEAGELMAQGRQLYEIGNLEELNLKVYISGDQLSQIKLNQEVEVLYDMDSEQLGAMTGQISWIASEAEFTPQMIQTREERVTQVYAVKIKVSNADGVLKIGMPGEVNFN